MRSLCMLCQHMHSLEKLLPTDCRDALKRREASYLAKPPFPPERMHSLPCCDMRSHCIPVIWQHVRFFQKQA